MSEEKIRELEKRIKTLEGEKDQIKERLNSQINFTPILILRLLNLLFFIIAIVLTIYMVPEFFTFIAIPCYLYMIGWGCYEIYRVIAIKFGKKYSRDSPSIKKCIKYQQVLVIKSILLYIIIVPLYTLIGPTGSGIIWSSENIRNILIYVDLGPTFFAIILLERKKLSYEDIKTRLLNRNITCSVFQIGSASLIYAYLAFFPQVLSFFSTYSLYSHYFFSWIFLGFVIPPILIFLISGLLIKLEQWKGSQK